MSLPATIYARWSSLEQGKGNSLKRQLEQCQELCARMGWLTDPEREIRDEGRSAYHGANRSEGAALYQFEQNADQGFYRNGHVFVVEHLDRITRKGWEDAYEFVKRLTSNGVTVATVDSSRIFSPGARVPMGTIMEIIVKSELAWEESEKKSRRTSAAWKAKLDRAIAGDKTAFTRLTPGWIEVDPETRRHSLIPQRVAVLNEIYEWAAAGMGTPRIVRKLNERGEPTWGTKKSRSDSWHVSYVSKLLTNRAVIGELQPMRRSRAGSATPKDLVLLDYYPRAIDPVLFERVQAERAARHGIGGRRGSRMANLFSGFVYCSSCGGRAAYGSTRKAGQTVKGTNGSRKPITYVARSDHSFLQCDNARRRVTDQGQLKCTNVAKVRYEYLEPVVLDHVLSYALDHMDFALPDAGAELESRVADLTRQLEERKSRLAILVESFSRTGSSAIEEGIISLEAETAELTSQMATARNELSKFRGALSPDELARRVQDIREIMREGDPESRLLARTRVNAALRKVVDFIHCRPDRSTLVVLGNASVALEVDENGQVTNFGDWTRRLDLHRGLKVEPGSRTSGALEAILRRTGVS